MRIEAPWPDSRLSPNRANGRHWKSVRKLKDDYKAIGYLLARGKKATGNALTIEFYPPDNRRRDADNMLSSAKHLIDGICQAIGIDDSSLNPVTVWKKEAVKGGKVVVIIE